MCEIDESFFKTWREKYAWPLDTSRGASEDKILALERKVVENILREGNLTIKQVLSEIVDWKTSCRVKNFNKNDDKNVEDKVNHVLGTLDNDPDNVSDCIKVFAFENKLQGVGIPVASAFRRFLDPVGHRYGIIDQNIARFLDEQGISKFEYENSYLARSCHNVGEYQRFHLWLQAKARELRKSTFTTVYGAKAGWTPVDIEMALFAYCTREETRKASERNFGAKVAKCPKCGSPLKLRRARRTGEIYRGCTNYPDCNYNERSY